MSTIVKNVIRGPISEVPSIPDRTKSRPLLLLLLILFNVDDKKHLQVVNLLQ